MAGFFPRLALFILWVARPTRIDAAFDTFLLPLLGIIFLPFATLMYVLLYTPGRGLSGWDWFWVVIAALLDIGHWGAGVTQRNPRGRPARRSAPGRERPRSPRACPCPHGQDHPSIRTSVRLASALPDVRQSGSRARPSRTARIAAGLQQLAGLLARKLVSWRGRRDPGRQVGRGSPFMGDARSPARGETCGRRTLWRAVRTRR